MVVGKKRVMIEIGTNKSRRGKKNEEIVVENMHESIISKEIFNAVNLHFNKRINGSREEIHRPLRKKVKCGYCKRTMSRSYTKRKYYKCQYAREDINSEHVRYRNKFYEDNIENVVLKAINNQINIIKNSCFDIDKIKIKLYKQELKMNELNHNIKTVKNKNIVTYEEYRANKINKDEFFIKKIIENAKIESFENEVKKIESEDKVIEENIAKIYKILKNSDRIDILDENVVNVFVNEIYVYPNDKIEIIWNFKNIMDSHVKIISPNLT
jgi:hypothetical protein